MTYKISDTAILIESDGKSVLIAESVNYTGSLTAAFSTGDLSPTYISGYFRSSGTQGGTSGYKSGGYGQLNPSDPLQWRDIIDKFPFSSDANATDVGDLTLARAGAGQSSLVNGYHSGGGSAAGSSGVNNIDKFPFAVDGNATDVGDLTQNRRYAAGQNSTSHGYSSGGGNPGSVNTIDKFPFSADANATDVGNLTVARSQSGNQSSADNGYTSGGDQSNLTIDKFPFAVDANATDVGDLSQGRSYTAGQNSATHGYTSGGELSPSLTTIDKFPFSSDANATDVGDLTIAKFAPGGQSSFDNGYTAGGYNSAQSPNRLNVIDKFPFSTDANATDVGDITLGRNTGPGHQV